MSLKDGQLTSRVIREFYSVYNGLGHGYLRSVYQKALRNALERAGLRADSDRALPVSFRGESVGDVNVHILVEDRLVLNLIPGDEIAEKHRHAVANHLRGTGLELGLVCCFGSKPHFARVVADQPREARSFAHSVELGSLGDSSLKHQELTESLLRHFYAVYNELGYGFEEHIFENAFEIVLRNEDVPLQRQSPVKVHYLGHLVGDFRADMIVDDRVLVELKAAEAIDDSHIAQTLNYLKATGIEVGLIFNFGPRATFRRLLFNRNRQIR